MTKVKWRGGSYGELPYVNVGNKIYIIRDIKMENKYVYMLHCKYPNYEHILHKPKDILKHLSYGIRDFQPLLRVHLRLRDGAQGFRSVHRVEIGRY